MCVKWERVVAMATTIHQLMWGSQAEHDSASSLNLQESFGILRERIQRAIAHEYPKSHVRAVTVTQEARAVDGLICMGYSITVALSIEQASAAPTTSDARRTMACQIESLISVAMLDMFCPIHVDVVNALPDLGSSNLSL